MVYQYCHFNAGVMMLIEIEPIDQLLSNKYLACYSSEQMRTATAVASTLRAEARGVIKVWEV